MATSMTGFGSAQGKNKSISLSIQMKTVNGRFLESKFRMPKIYQGFENDLRSKLSESFFRGNVEVFIHRADIDTSGEKEVLVDAGLARGWLKASHKLSKELKLEFTPTFETLLKVPDV